MGVHDAVRGVPPLGSSSSFALGTGTARATHLVSPDDYDANGNRDAGAIRDQTEWTVFNDRFPPDEAEPKYIDDAEVVRWFQC